MMGKHQLFIEKKKVARSFLRGLTTYDREAVVQRQVNERLMALLDKQGFTPERQILEIGCCTGLLTELLYDHLKPHCLYINDLVPEFYQPVMTRLSGSVEFKVKPLFGDIETIKLPEQLDLIISSSAFQWFSDLEGFLNRIPEVLSHDGTLVFSMFGEGTFYELSELIGAGLKYHRFQSVRDMVDNSLRITHCGIERDQLFFKHRQDVLKHIQATGVGGVGGFKWTPRRLEKFNREYQETFRSENGVSLSYVSYYFTARKRK